MKIFISYAREQARIAQSISVRLLDDGHQSFFDLTTLQPGESFDSKIRHAINHADLFLFLISPASVSASAYALTELGIAQTRWPNPSGKVLPVMAEPTDITEIPSYLVAVTILKTRGNLEADVLAEVAKIAGRRSRRLPWIWLLAGVMALTVVLLVGKITSHPAAFCYLKAQILSDRGVVPEGMMIDVTYAGTTNTFLISEDASAAIDVGPFKRQDDRWTLTLRDPDGRALGTEVLIGCVGAAHAGRLHEIYNLVISPRI